MPSFESTRGRGRIKKLEEFKHEGPSQAWLGASAIFYL